MDNRIGYLMDNRITTVRNLYNRISDLIDKYQSNKGDKYKIIVIFRDLLNDAEYHYDNSPNTSSVIYFKEAATLWDYCMSFCGIIASDHPIQIKGTDINIIDNIIEHYKKIHGRDKVINNILNE